MDLFSACVYEVGGLTIAVQPGMQIVVAMLA